MGGLGRRTGGRSNPVKEAHEVDDRGRQEMVEMGFCRTSIASIAVRHGRKAAVQLGRKVTPACDPQPPLFAVRFGCKVVVRSRAQIDTLSTYSQRRSLTKRPATKASSTDPTAVVSGSLSTKSFLAADG